MATSTRPAAPEQPVARPADPEPVSWTRPRIVGLVLLALGVLALIATFDIPSARDGWAIQGPRFAPLLASIALILLAVCFLVRTVIRADVELARYATAEDETTHWPTPAALLGLLVAYALLLTALGYALATTIFVWLAAWLLASEKPGRDAIVGPLLGVVGVILGPLMETQARRTLVGSGGDLGVFVGRPLTIVLLLIALAALVVPHLPAIMARLRGGDSGPGAFGAAEE